VSKKDTPPDKTELFLFCLNLGKALGQDNGRHLAGTTVNAVGRERWKRENEVREDEGINKRTEDRRAKRRETGSENTNRARTTTTEKKNRVERTGKLSRA